MTDLENPPENPCFGCGPTHSRGLHLRFETDRAPDGEPEVRTHFTPKTDEIGWPTLFHHGLHFMVLYETSYWTALTLGGQLWVSQGRIEYAPVRLPRVGIEHTARARIVARSPESLTIRASSSTAEGKPCGALESTWTPVRLEAIERARVPLPDYLRSEIGRP